jgi:glycosyltransferase involved in cell wall biosynthesis
MKVLIISPYLPHPLAGHGGGVYLYDMVRHLSSLYEVTLISFADEHERHLAPDLRSLRVKLHLVSRVKGPVHNLRAAVTLTALRGLQFTRSMLSWEPYIVCKFRSRTMARMIRDVTVSQPFDIAQLEYTQMGQYVSDVRSGRTILHEHDVVLRTVQRYFTRTRSPLSRAWYLLELCRLNSYERRMVRQFDGISTLTRPDALLLEWQTRNPHVKVLSPGVDLPSVSDGGGQRNPDSLLFLGNLTQLPNDDAAIWLCTDIFPRIVAEHPAATLTIVGRGPSRALLAAASNPRIKLLDFVKDLRPHLLQAGVFVAPLRLGGGIKIKILDALAHGCPVVTTPVGTEGITGLTSSSVLISRTAEGITRHCISLLENPARAAQLGLCGRDVVRENFSWDTVLARTTSYYNSLLHP